MDRAHAPCRHCDEEAQMLAYACVYRHSRPTAREQQLTGDAAAAQPLLRKYLSQYDNTDCYLDWGDDPSFSLPLGSRYGGQARPLVPEYFGVYEPV